MSNQNIEPYIQTDRVFDGWAERFDNRIYADQNPKGIIRTEILRRDLTEVILEPEKSKLKILDMGAGLGQMSIWLASQGHQVTAVEPSQDMLNVARKNVDAADLANMIELKKATLQQYAATATIKFDVIIFHAVLEWLAEPEQAIRKLGTLLSTTGKLSIMFYNKNSAQMRSLVVGNFTRVQTDQLHGDGVKRMAPTSPQDPALVEIWLNQHKLKILRWSGVRCFYDYMLPDARKNADIADVLDTELRFSLQKQWQSLARYQHVICEK